MLCAGKDRAHPETMLEGLCTPVLLDVTSDMNNTEIIQKCNEPSDFIGGRILPAAIRKGVGRALTTKELFLCITIFGIDYTICHTIRKKKFKKRICCGEGTRHVMSRELKARCMRRIEGWSRTITIISVIIALETGLIG